MQNVPHHSGRAAMLLTLLLLSVRAVVAQPSIVQQPTDRSVSQGATAIFTVSAAGTGTLTYQWNFRDQRLAGATNATLALTNVQPSQAGSYAVDVRDATGSVTSHSAFLDVDAAFTKITTDPVVTDAADGKDAAWIDFDGDGDLDLYVSSGSTGVNLLYHNDGNGQFTRLTDGPLFQTGPGSLGAAWADVDNDGRPDLFISRQSGPGLLFRQQADGTFTRIALSAGGFSWRAAWADYDNDGFVDLLVADNTRTVLWHNDGTGNLVAVTNTPISTRGAFAISWVDYDNDGDPDLFVANLNGNSQLYRNDGGGVFVPITSGAIVEDSANASSAAWGDYDNDGYPDLFLSRRSDNGALQVSFLFHNNGDGTFTKVEQSPFTEDAGDWTSASWGDYDNDGWLDLFVTSSQGGNRLYHNNRDGTFTRVLSGSLVNDRDNSFLGTWGDFDQDGFLDLFVSNGTEGGGDANDYLYRNNGNSNAWLTVRCAGTVSNRSAIGTKVRVLATIYGQRFWQMREITSAGGAPLEAHFGLGDATWIEKVRVEWPSGIVQEFDSQWPPINPRQILTVTEPRQTFDFASSRFEVVEGEKQAMITVTQNASRTGPVSVDYATVPNSTPSHAATPGADFVAVSGTLLFAPGETQKTFAVPIIDDGLVEGDETLSLVLSHPSARCVLGTNAPGVLVIHDNEVPTLIDPSFRPAIGAGNTPSTILVQPDGKILVGGQFFFGTSFQLVMRLNPNGSRDTTFRPASSVFPTTSPGTAYVNPIALQPDGKILIGGVFSIINGVKRENIARLNSDGSPDVTFVTSVHPTTDPGGSLRGVEGILVQPDGKILISGAFDSVNNSSQVSVARLNADGTLDTGDVGHVTFPDFQTLPLPDGSVLVGGENCLGHMLADGTQDPGFSYCPGSPNAIFPMAVRADGKILVRIREQVSLTEGSPVGLARLNSDSSLDQNYTLPAAKFGSDYFIQAGAFAQDGSALVAIQPGNGATEPGLVRLFADGAEPGFQLATDQVRVNENLGTVTAIVQRTGDSSSSADVTLTAANGSAKAGQDFLFPDSTIHFDPLETTKTITIPIFDTQLIRSNAQFQIKLTSAAPGVILGSGLTTTTITIANNEHPGAVDPNFHPPLQFFSFGPNGGVYPPTLALQPDGKILVAGALSATNPATGLPSSLVRLNPDGSLDPAWRLTISAPMPAQQYWFDPQQVYALALQSNNDILIGGSGALTVNGQSTPFVARVHTDGSLDPTFAVDATALTDVVRQIAIDSSGKILVSQQVQGENNSYYTTLVRLYPDGLVDPTWNMGTLSGGVWQTAIYSVVPVPGGKVLIAGDFGGLQGVARNSIARLNEDGSLDPTFNSGTGGHGSISSMALQPDGKIVVAGDIDTFDGVVISGFARLQPDGTLDKKFATYGDAGGVSVNDQTVPIALALQPDGRILLGGGGFSTFTGTVTIQRSWVARANATGTMDQPFDAGGGLYSRDQCCGALQQPVSTLLVLPDGSLLAGGGFTSFDGLAQPGLVRLLGDPAPRLLPAPPPQLTLNGLPGRTYVLETSPNLQNWMPIQTNKLSTYLLHTQDPDPATAANRFYRAAAP